MPTAKRQEILAEIESFRQRFKTLLMATVSDQGKPEASYAPYFPGERFTCYVYLSELAKHTQNLLATGRAGILFIEDEKLEQNKPGSNPFARKRLSFDCLTESIPRDSQAWVEIMDGFSVTFGDFVEVIKPLTDFHLFRLKAQQGSYVKGFAQAFSIGGEGLSEIHHLRGRNEPSDS